MIWLSDADIWQDSAHQSKVKTSSQKNCNFICQIKKAIYVGGFLEIEWKSWWDSFEEKSANQQWRHLSDKKSDIPLIRGQTENIITILQERSRKEILEFVLDFISFIFIIVILVQIATRDASELES